MVKEFNGSSSEVFTEEDLYHVFHNDDGSKGIPYICLPVESGESIGEYSNKVIPLKTQLTKTVLYDGSFYDLSIYPTNGKNYVWHVNQDSTLTVLENGAEYDGYTWEFNIEIKLVSGCKVRFINVKPVTELTPGAVNCCTVKKYSDGLTILLVNYVVPLKNFYSYKITVSSPVDVNGTVGNSVSVDLSEHIDNPTSWPASIALAAGSSLPAGLKQEGKVITGKPTVAGSSSAVFKVSAYGCGDETLTVNFDIASDIPAGTITAPSSQSVEGTQGEELAASIATGVSASNGASVSFAVKQGSALPAGLALSTAGDVTGTPTAAGSTTTTVVLSADGCDSVEMTVTLNIAESIQQGTITVTTNPTIQGVVGTAITSYNLASCVTVSNGQTPSFRWNDVYSPQPPWLTLTTSGMLSGTPTSIPSPTTGKVLVSANKCSNEPNINITWDIINAGTITVDSQTISGTVGNAVSLNLRNSTTVSNGQTPTFAVKSGNTLPAGIELSSAGVLSGTPTATSSATVVVTITARGCPTKDVNITFDITEAPSVSDGFPVSFTVSSVSYQGQDKTAPCGTYTRTGEAFPLTAGSVTYPVYSYTGTDSNIYYICVVANMFGGDGPAWMLTATKPTASSVTSALAITGYGGTTLKSGSYEPADTAWTGNNGNATVSWEM